MFRIFHVFTLIFLLACCVEAAPSPAPTPTPSPAPLLSLPSSVVGVPGAFVSVRATTAGNTVRWLALDAGLNVFPTDLLKDTKTAVCVASNAGSYRLLAVTAIANEVTPPAICSVVIQTAEPAPGPPPGPSPNPAPPSTEAVSWAIVVVNNAGRTPAVGQLVSSPSLLSGLQSRGVSYRVLDMTDPLVAANGYAASVNAIGGPPALLLFGANGKRIKTVALPGSINDFFALLPAPKQVPSFTSPCGPLGCPRRGFGVD